MGCCCSSVCLGLVVFAINGSITFPSGISSCTFLFLTHFLFFVPFSSLVLVCACSDSRFSSLSFITSTFVPSFLSFAVSSTPTRSFSRGCSSLCPSFLSTSLLIISSVCVIFSTYTLPSPLFSFARTCSFVAFRSATFPLSSSCFSFPSSSFTLCSAFFAFSSLSSAFRAASLTFFSHCSSIPVLFPSSCRAFLTACFRSSSAFFTLSSALFTISNSKDTSSSALVVLSSFSLALSCASFSLCSISLSLRSNILSRSPPSVGFSSPSLLSSSLTISVSMPVSPSFLSPSLYFPIPASLSLSPHTTSPSSLSSITSLLCSLALFRLCFLPLLPCLPLITPFSFSAPLSLSPVTFPPSSSLCLSFSSPSLPSFSLNLSSSASLPVSVSFLDISSLSSFSCVHLCTSRTYCGTVPKAAIKPSSSSLIPPVASRSF
eukprot:comp7634_c0_seq1/m.3276 comp7634_c0_seq1/g.3276  ORF comp7634_c0_seq1/g.3276 comp7634_c0_seq1/m.3276 type:complete len:432 (+) comp7634_c0_seq1:687-1982(+)